MATSPSNSARTLDGWLTWHALAMLAAGLAVAATGRGAWLAVVAAVSFFVLWHKGAPPLVAVGVANLLTAARLVVLLLAASWLGQLTAAYALAAFAFNVAVDAVDGQVARRRGQATPFGAVFDREVDALFVLVAYLYFHVMHDVGAWVLLPGLIPYCYRLLAAMAPVAIAADRKESFAAPLAALNFALLVAAAAAPAHAPLILFVSAAVVLGSFCGSFWGLYRDAHSLS
jgi:phosphatidylglycerophosphate synthase